MLVIRMQRTGRKGHAQFRVVVQDSRRTPTSGKIVAAIGSYNPHTKTALLNTEKISFYLEHGAQPSDRVVKLLTAEGVKLPKWVASATKKEGAIRNMDKLRRNAPPAPAAEAPAEESVVEAEAVEAETAETNEAPVEEIAEATEAVEEIPAEESAETAEEPSTEAPAEESAEEPAAEETAAADAEKEA
jgi:small subunit ribosomal protein S16